MRTKILALCSASYNSIKTTSVVAKYPSKSITISKIRDQLWSVQAAKTSICRWLGKIKSNSSWALASRRKVHKPGWKRKSSGQMCNAILAVAIDWKVIRTSVRFWMLKRNQIELTLKGKMKNPLSLIHSDHAPMISISTTLLFSPRHLRWTQER